MASGRGFGQLFEKFQNKLRDAGDQTQLSGDFGKLLTDEDRVNHVIQLNAFKDVFGSYDYKLEGKSSPEADELKMAGNKAFQGRQYVEAVRLYNLCVAATPQDESSAAYALGVANRSAALLHVGHHQLCLRDISEAFSRSYPKDLQYKLYERRGRCHLEMGNIQTAREELLKAQVLVNNLGDDKKLVTWKKNIEKLVKQCETTNHSSGTNCVKTVEPHNRNGKSERSRQGLDHITRETPKLDVTNEKYLSLSSKVEVKYTPEQGRFIVAKENIYPGDLIMVEKPYASVLLDQRTLGNAHKPSPLDGVSCHHCLQRSLVVTPCNKCRVTYCSAECQKSGYIYHQGECGLQKILRESGVGKFGLLALRTVTKAGLQFLVKYNEKVKDLKEEQFPESKGCSEDGCYRGDDFSAIHNLVTHDGERTVGDLFKRASMAGFLLQCLIKAGFFRPLCPNDADIPAELQGSVGGLLLSHLQAFPCNAHEVTELPLNPEDVPGSIPCEIGAAIYSTLSLFNHSCDPAVNRNFYGDVCVVTAIKSLTPGEELSDNYGAVYAMQPRSERQDKLKPQYFFTCQCKACVEDWPLYPELPNSSPTWKCRDCQQPLSGVNKEDANVECAECHKMQNLQEKESVVTKTQSVFEDGFQNLIEMKVDEALPRLMKQLTEIHKHVCLPWQPVNNYQEAIKQCLAIRANCYVLGHSST